METRNRSKLFSGLVVDIEQFDVRIGAKGWHTFQIVRHPGGVGVLPLHDDGTVTLIRQLRPAVGGTLLEIPAGRLHPGEDPAVCGGREMAEETGLSARELVPLGYFYPSPGVFDEVIHLFLARNLEPADASPEEHEVLEASWVPLQQAMDLASSGRLKDAKSVIGLLWARERLSAS